MEERPTVEEMEERRRQKEIFEAQKMESLATLAGGIAHDFNNILSAILGYTELAMGELPGNCRPHAHLREVLSSVDRARDIVKQILAFSRQRPEERLPVRVGTLLEGIARILRPSTPPAIEIRTEIGDDCGYVLADPSQLHQVVTNLCANAGYAMGEGGGTLRLSCESVTVDGAPESLPRGLPGDSFIRITVGDSGPGMKPEVKARIFEPYYTDKPTGEGNGLGLAVALGIVEGHGGRITVESEPGRGSTFSVYLPEISGGDQPAESGEEPMPRGVEEVLLVDDEPSLTRIGKQMLERLGYVVTARTDSRSALELVRVDPNRFDVVITDQSMPDLTGTAFARELLALRPELPVIICTGNNNRRHEEEARRIGVKAFVLKPYSGRTLAGVVRNVLDDKVLPRQK